MIKGAFQVSEEKLDCLITMDIWSIVWKEKVKSLKTSSRLIKVLNINA